MMAYNDFETIDETVVNNTLADIQTRIQRGVVGDDITTERYTCYTDDYVLSELYGKELKEFFIPLYDVLEEDIGNIRVVAQQQIFNPEPDYWMVVNLRGVFTQSYPSTMYTIDGIYNHDRIKIVVEEDTPNLHLRLVEIIPIIRED